MKSLKPIEVAKLMNVTEQTIRDYLDLGKLKATATGAIPVDSIVKFYQTELEAYRNKRNPELEDLKKEKLEIENQHKKLKLDLDAKAYVTKQEVQIALAEAATLLKEVLENYTKKLPYEIAGADIKAVAGILEQRFTKLLADYSNRLRLHE